MVRVSAKHSKMEPHKFSFWECVNSIFCFEEEAKDRLATIKYGPIGKYFSIRLFSKKPGYGEWTISPVEIAGHPYYAVHEVYKSDINTHAGKRILKEC